MTADFLTEDSYLGDITDPLTLNRYNYVKSSPLNYIDPSGQKTEDQIKGDDAYRTLQAFLTAVAPGIIEAEYLVINHLSNASGVGRADIVFHGPFGDEVYEIKPGIWSNKVVHPILNAKGQMQRQEYVTGMTKTYLESIDTDYPLPPVIYNGKSLNLIVNQLVLPSISDPTISIKYRTYATPPGMIYYDYDVHRKYGCGKVFKTRIKEAVMHSSQAEKL